MVTKTINIKESAYHALRAHKRAGESYSDVILRITEGEEKSVCDFLQTIDPAVRSEIAGFVKMKKSELDHVRSRKDCQATRPRLHRHSPAATSRPAG
ncbi:antitoxin VapB family protein [Methanoregula sp.]|uniref:antitoxin VapB family protein n=1 Tax=Methanoregula sp. TaxID=2052170 RepID=UPI002611304F|nr:antitoxin VapB family protein [Methanoregula sp.]MDD5142068.1 antitoxin VapB family protein [Methanoregula sp.]